MNRQLFSRAFCLFLWAVSPATAAPVMDPVTAATIPAGKTLIVPVTATSPNGQPLTFTASSSTNGIAVEVHTNNPFWKMSVAQAAPTNAPGAFLTPFRGGTAVVTNVGDMTFMLFRDLAPRTVDVISGLTASGLYTSNTIFHRVIAGFMNQGGDPATNGTGGPVFRYDDEFHPRAIFSGNGQLALANSGKDTDGSQFFVTVAPFRFGDFGYTIFGQLLRGFNVLSNINNTATDANSRPLADVIITKASLVPDRLDTVLTLSGTNLAGVTGTISIVADDGAGGRATNTFTATTAADANIDPPFIYPGTVTNLVAPANVPLTNNVSVTNLPGGQVYWFDFWQDGNSTNSYINSANGQLVIVPNANFAGTTGHSIFISTNAAWAYYYYYFGVSVAPYDKQAYTFTFGDTPISARATNFTAGALSPFTNQLLATFTNGTPGSSPTNFSATINWGDNVISGGSIATNFAGGKEVRGAHTYSNSGEYPVYVTIRSATGASATAVTTATVPPLLSLARNGSNSIVRWPAWAADYQLQTNDNPGTTNWASPTNFSILSGYENVLTHGGTNRSLFFRLKK
ncbi:MAG: peptidylprolyl isomerase [Verrucomicrobiota bacterium]